MGHIHRPSHRANVYYCGSFDRMVHGEEEPKGFYTFTYTDKWVSKFIVNNDSNKFITIEPKGDTIDDRLHDLLDKMQQVFPDRRGYVRVLYTNPEDRGIYHRVAVQTYPDIIFSGKRIGDAADNTLDLAELDIDVFADVKLNANNLGELVYDFLVEHNKADGITKPSVLNCIQNLLTE